MPMNKIHSSRPFLGRIRSSRLFICTVINLAVFTDSYLYGLIIPVLPFALVERVNVHESDVQRWIGILLAAYGAGLIIGSPIAGWFADRGDSRRGPYLWGLIALAASTIALSVARMTWVLFVGRLVQGASSAIVHTVGLAILADTAGQAGIGPAMGFFTMSIALGVVFGPIIGGILYHQLGYQAVYISAYALVGLDFLLRVLMLASKDGALGKSEITTEDRTYGTIQPTHDGNKPRQPPNTTAADSTSSLLSRSSYTPSTDLTSQAEDSTPPEEESSTRRHTLSILLSTPRMLAAILGDFMQSVIITGLESILPLRIKTLFHYNSMQVALIFFAISLPSFAGPAVGHLSDKVGAKICVCLGFLCAAPLIVLLRLMDRDGAAQVALLCVLLFAIGVSLSFIHTPVFSEVMYVVDDKVATQPGVFRGKGAYAQAFGLLTVAYAAGSLVGPLMGGLLVERVGWNNLTLATGIICALCVLPCFWATGGRRVPPKRHEDVDEGVGHGRHRGTSA